MAAGSDEATPVGLGPTRRQGPADDFCRWCGTAAGGCDQTSCRRALDPPRHCPECGRRLRVLVTPAGVRAECRHHGEVTDGRP